jgi:hypothetical protein
MGIFNGPPLTEEQRRFTELHDQAARNGLLLTENAELRERVALLNEHLSQACGNIKKRDDHIAELKGGAATLLLSLYNM